MTAQTWSAIAAWVALAISVATVVYGVIRPWLKERRSKPSAQLDLLNYQTGSGWQEEVRIVVTNHGPAIMKAVEVQAFDDGGTSLQVTEPSVSQLWPRMPVEFLHVEQSLYLTLSRSLSTRDARSALVRWTDGRRGQQSKSINLSYHRMI